MIAVNMLVTSGIKAISIPHDAVETENISFELQDDLPFWIDALVVGDAFRIEFYVQEIAELKEEYGVEGFHNTVQEWMEYWEWTKYPQDWSILRSLVMEGNRLGVPSGACTGFTPTDATNEDRDVSVGFSYLYEQLLSKDKWKDPLGDVVFEPYTTGTSKSFSGTQVWREYDDQDSSPVMQTQNPFWVEYLVDWSKKIINTGAEGIMYDNADMIFPPFGGGGFGDQSTWEGRDFARYLREKYSEQELDELGIDKDRFNMTDYMTQKFVPPNIYGNYKMMRGTWEYSYPHETIDFPGNNEIMSDPIVKDFILYHYEQMIKFTEQLTTQVKTYAKTNDHPVILSTNNYDNWIPHLAVAPYFDVNYIESDNFQTPPYSNNVATAKRGLATVDFAKPVWIGEWILGFYNAFRPHLTPTDFSNLIKIRVAETYASGAIMLIPFGTGDPDEGWPPNRLVEGSEREQVAPYYKWISENPKLFTDIRPYSKVAVVYSVPTAIWNFFPVVELKADDYFNEVNGWARGLEFNYIPYDAIILGHEDVFNDTVSVERLSQYDVVVLPGCTSVSDEHLNMLREVTNRGTHILITSDFASHDEYWTTRNQNTLQWLDDSLNVHYVESNVGLTLMNGLSQLMIDESAVARMKETFDLVVSNSSRVSVEGVSDPHTLLISVMGTVDDDLLILHFVNTDYEFNSSSDSVTPKPAFNVTFSLQDLNKTSTMLLSPDHDPEPISFHRENEWITITMPRLTLWSLVVFEEPKDLIYSNLVIDPEKSYEGESTTISVTVENPNISPIQTSVEIKLNEEPMETVFLNIEGGKTTQITRIFTQNEGTYNIQVGELVGTFTVEKAEVQEPEPQPEPEPEFVVSDLFASPDEVEEGEGVTFSVRVTNIGEMEGSYTVDFKVEGETIETEIVTLARGESTTVSFEETWDVGSYTVEVDGLAGSFTVKSKPSFWDKIPGFPYESIILGLIAVIIILWYAHARRF